MHRPFRLVDLKKSLVIYLDYNATTPLAPEVLAAMLPVLEQAYGNPSSIHAPGRYARAQIDEARDRLAGLLHARPHEIIFTGGGTEADNLAVIGLARRAVREEGKERHLITCATEHHAVLHAVEWLERHEGYRVTRLSVDAGGQIDLQQLSDAATPATALVSIMSANNETGVLQPVAEIARLCRSRGIVFHSDMIQSFGKQPLDVRSEDAPDAISLTAHKFYGPKGVGALWLKGGVSIDPIAYGGSHENQRRPGTENVAAIVGLAAAAERVTARMSEEQPRLLALRDQLWAGIASACPTARLNGHPTERLANTVNITFPGCDGESLLMSFDLAGFAVSSGSACMVGSVQPSHVLLAMGVPAEVAQSAVRFSMGEGTTEKEVQKLVAQLPVLIDRLLASP